MSSCGRARPQMFGRLIENAFVFSIDEIKSVGNVISRQFENQQQKTFPEFSLLNNMQFFFRLSVIFLHSSHMFYFYFPSRTESKSSKTNRFVFIFLCIPSVSVQPFRLFQKKFFYNFYQDAIPALLFCRVRRLKLLQNLIRTCCKALKNSKIPFKFDSKPDFQINLLFEGLKNR